MGLLGCIINTSVQPTSATTLQDLSILLKYFFMEFFFSKLFLLCQSYPDGQNFHSSSAEYRPSPWLVPLPIHSVNNSLKGQLAVKEYSCLVEGLNEELQDHEDSCAVCFEKLEASHKIRELQNCRHVFHRECLDSWIDRGHATCPLCRAKLLAGHGEYEESNCRGDPWRSERMIYLFGEDYLMDSAG